MPTGSLRPGIAALSLALPMLLLPVQMAEAVTGPPVRVLAEGALRAQGAAAVVALRLTCTRPQNFYPLSVTVRQATSTGASTILYGDRTTTKCGPTGARVLVPVTSTPPAIDRALAPGTVLVSVNYGECGIGDGCGTTHGVQRLTERADLDRPITSVPGLRTSLRPFGARLVDGVLLRYRFGYRCDAPAQINHASFSVHQRAQSGDEVDRSEEYFWDWSCDAQQHVGRITLPPYSYAYRAGPAFVTLAVDLETQIDGERVHYVDQVWREVELS